MKTTTLLHFAAIWLAAATLGHAGAAPQLDRSGRYAAGELLVKWKDGPDSYAAALGNASIGAAVQRDFSAIGWQWVRLPEGMSVHEGLEAYRKLDTVLAVEPNGAIQPIPPPRDLADVSALDSTEGRVPLESAVGTARSGPRLQGPSPGLIPDEAALENVRALYQSVKK